MRSAVESPRRVKPSKRPIEDFDTDPAPTTKYRRLQPAASSPTPSPTASPIHHRPSQSRSTHKQRRKVALRPEPTRSLKRVREDHDPDCAPASQRPRQSSNSKYLFALPAPKPDRHYGYPNGQDSDWTDSEVAVVDHRVARPYTQPTRESLFPFYMIEIKSEATGGTLYVAENQAAISGAHSVHSLLWLRSQADPTRNSVETWTAKDAVTFVNNILDYGLEGRQSIFRDTLKLLHPISKQWKRARPTSALTDVAESFTSDDGRSSKSQRTYLEVVSN
ncbi:MAG: hypothetical protein Q9175_004315 [Cornicularia normoerica]